MLEGDFNIHVERPDDVNAMKFIPLLHCYVNRSTHVLGGHLNLLFTLDDVLPPRVSYHETGLSDHSLIRWNSFLPKPALLYSTTSCRPWKQLNMLKFKAALACSALYDDTSWSAFDVDELALLFDSEVTKILNALLDPLQGL